VARKQPPEVAGLGRPETPEESQARIAQARAERRGRQTMKNLAWSMLASLGVVALLIFVVVRPDHSLVEPVDWRGVAFEASSQLPAEPVVPELSQQWNANRAEISQVGTTASVWSVGLISDQQGFVFIDQGFGTDSSWLGLRTRQATPTNEVTLGDEGAPGILFQEYDRRANDPQGNYAYLLVHTADQTTIVIGGTSKDAVTEIAQAVAEFLIASTTP